MSSFYARRFQMHKKDTGDLIVFLRFWDLRAQELLVKCWWNRPLKKYIDEMSQPSKLNSPEWFNWVILRIKIYFQLKFFILARCFFINSILNIQNFRIYMDNRLMALSGFKNELPSKTDSICLKHTLRVISKHEVQLKHKTTKRAEIYKCFPVPVYFQKKVKSTKRWGQFLLWNFYYIWLFSVIFKLRIYL